MPGLVMANVGHWQNKSSGSTVNSITATGTARSASPACTPTTWVDVEKITEPVGV